MAKKEVEKLPPIDTWAKALAWMEEQGKATRGPEHKSAKEALFWFVSWQEVGDIGDLTHKDIAWYFMHGLPKATVKSCREFIRCERANWEEEGGEDYSMAAPYDLRAELEDFWGVKS